MKERLVSAPRIPKEAQVGSLLERPAGVLPSGVLGGRRRPLHVGTLSHGMQLYKRTTRAWLPLEPLLDKRHCRSGMTESPRSSTRVPRSVFRSSLYLANRNLSHWLRPTIFIALRLMVKVVLVKLSCQLSIADCLKKARSERHRALLSLPSSRLFDTYINHSAALCRSSWPAQIFTGYLHISRPVFILLFTGRRFPKIRNGTGACVQHHEAAMQGTFGSWHNGTCHRLGVCCIIDSQVA